HHRLPPRLLLLAPPVRPHPTTAGKKKKLISRRNPSKNRFSTAVSALEREQREMSVQCAAHAVRALAVLPAPASPRRRTTCVSLSLSPRRPGRAVAPVRAAEPSSPPAAAPAAQTSGASAGKAVVPDDEFSLAKLRIPGYFLLLGTWSLRLTRCQTEQSCPLMMNRWSFAGVLRCDWSRSWDLPPVVWVRLVFQPASGLGVVSPAANLRISSHNHRHGLEVCRTETSALYNLR
ncbi:unnamed protein product, partial [Urochloa humidicola]